LTPEEYRFIELTMTPSEIVTNYAPRTVYEFSLALIAGNPDLHTAFAAWAVLVPDDTPARDDQLFIACVEALRVYLARHGDVLHRRLRKRVAAHVAVSELRTVKECAVWLGQLSRVCRSHGVTRGALHMVMVWLVCEVTYVDDQTYSTSPFRLASVLPKMFDYDVRLVAYVFMSCLRVYNTDLRAKNLWGSESEPAEAAQAWYRLQHVMWPEPTLLDQNQKQALSGSEVSQCSVALSGSRAPRP